MKVMVLTDNDFIYNSFKELIKHEKFCNIEFDFFFSWTNTEFSQKYIGNDFKSVNLKQMVDVILDKYQLVLSLHCKQLFPKKLVNGVRCINVHPGFNPFNRGWYPQVFSIINKLPAGVTIHEMDELLDHGPIIVQKMVEIQSWETSYDVYSKIQNIEIELLSAHLRDILDNNYDTKKPVSKGNINLKKDFNVLCELDLEKTMTLKEAIDYLRAMTFAGYKNAYFYDEKGNKVYVEINLELFETIKKT